jgi:membrane-associated phospholipid phosphatase
MEVKLKSKIYNFIFALSLLFFSFEKTIAQPDTTKSFIQSKFVKHFSAPILFTGASIYTLNKNVPINKFSTQQRIQNNYPNFHSQLDDYTLFAPVVLTYGVGFLNNNYVKNDFLNRSILLVKSGVIMAALVLPTKYLTNIQRPDNSTFDAYPSGHTANAFMMATFMHEELKHQSIWYSVGAYSVATSVGVMRMLNNRHWSSDVLLGAAIGIASTKIAYLTHQFKWGKDSRISLHFIPVFLGSEALTNN